MLDAHTLEKKAEIPCGKKPIRIAFVPNGVIALVSCADSGELAIIDARSRTERKRIALFAQPVPPDHKPGDALPPSLPIGVLCDPDGRYAYVACNAAREGYNNSDGSLWR